MNMALMRRIKGAAQKANASAACSLCCWVHGDAFSVWGTPMQLGDWAVVDLVYCFAPYRGASKVSSCQSSSDLRCIMPSRII